MSQELTVLITAIDAVGHFNACIGIGEQLRDRGHKVVFVVPDNWRNKLSPQGFIEEWYNPIIENKEANKLEVWGEIVAQMQPVFLLSPKEQIAPGISQLYKEAIRQTKHDYTRLKEIIQKVRPHVILADLVIHQPAVMDSGIPWILSVSINPLGISNKNVPPAFAGYPTLAADKTACEDYAREYKSHFENMFKDLKEWVTEKGGSELKYHAPLFVKYSPFANIYMCPKELDYTEFRPNPPKFYRFDTFMRNPKETFEIPEQLKNKPGKLIYFSMGTIGCSELGLMRRLISILAKSPHRYIISKGPLADKIELADNMWGAVSVPQPKVIPLVDLVISHGGNNTVTETLYFGKPLIIFPLFADQPDNAQRVMELGLGLRFHGYHVTEQELLAGIEKLLVDKEVAQKVSQISKRMQASNSQSRAAELVENVALGKDITKFM